MCGSATLTMVASRLAIALAPTVAASANRPRRDRNVSASETSATVLIPTRVCLSLIRSGVRCRCSPTVARQLDGSLVDQRVAGEAEEALADLVALDLRRAACDRHGAVHQHE